MVNVQTEHLENHRARLTVEVDPDRLNQAMRQTAKRLSKRARIPGFRPGKAPFNVVVSMLGFDYVLSETLDKIGNDLYREALDVSQIQPYGPGNLENIEEGGQKLIFTFPKQPEIQLGDYRSIRIEYEEEEVTDDMVNRAMEDLRQRQAVVEEVDRPAQMGDQVTFSHLQIMLLEDDDIDDEDEDEDDDDIDDEDEDEDDDDIDGEVIFHEHDYAYVLFEDKEHERLFPGFAAEIVSGVKGDDLEFYLQIDDDFEDKDIAGHALFCQVSIAQVHARTVPEWSDDLAKRISKDEFETILELRMDVRKNLAEALKNRMNQEIATKAMDKMLEGATLHYPEELIDDYIDDFVDSLRENIARQGLTLENWLTITRQTEEELRAQYRTPAVTRAERALVLAEFVEQEKLNVSIDEIEAEIDRMSGLFSGDQATQFRQFLSTDHSRINIQNDLITNRAWDRMAAIAKGENPPIEAETPTAADEPAVVVDNDSTASPDEAE